MKSKELKGGREAARKELIKSEVMTFRIPSDELEKLYSLAEKLNVRVTVMVRDWVVERLTAELGEKNQATALPNWEIQDIRNRLAVVEEKLIYKDKKINSRVREKSTEYKANSTQKARKKPTK